MNKFVSVCLAIVAVSCLAACAADPVEQGTEEETEPKMQQYYFPAEDDPHEGTWLNWPHHYTYGEEYRDEVEDIWLAMVKALHTGEAVHIVAYDEVEQERITELLQEEEVDLAKVDFVIAKSDDVWSRDTGPMFVFDSDSKLAIVDFAFDGWGGKTPYQNDDIIPQAAAAAKGFPIVPVPDFVLEGGSVELDGSGTAMLCKSSVVSKSRNPKLSVEQAEQYLSQYLGATNFIWLEGAVGEDITDAHIDGMARFLDSETLLTVSEEDFYELYETIPEQDYDVLLQAKNAKGEQYEIVELPMTAQNVDGLEYKGSYLNYYVGNEVVLLPVYNDVNDTVAQQLVAGLYPDRKVIPIDVTALYQYGGMLHCVTQQQPKG